MVRTTGGKHNIQRKPRTQWGSNRPPRQERSIQPLNYSPKQKSNQTTPSYPISNKSLASCLILSLKSSTSNSHTQTATHQPNHLPTSGQLSQFPTPKPPFRPRETGHPYVFTVEASYTCGAVLNYLPPAQGDKQRAATPRLSKVVKQPAHMPYCPSVYR